MAKHDTKTKEHKAKGGKGKVAATLGVLVAGAAIAGGAAFAASRKPKDSGSDDSNESAPPGTGVASDDAPGVVPQPMRYTGSGTPDMAISYTPGLDQDDSRVASARIGDADGELGTPEQRDALAGVQS